jgi:hypothetical protein
MSFQMTTYLCGRMSVQGGTSSFSNAGGKVRSLESRRARASRGIHGGSECGRAPVDAATKGLPRVGNGHGGWRRSSYRPESGERVTERPRSTVARSCGGGDMGTTLKCPWHGCIFPRASTSQGIEAPLGSAAQSRNLLVTRLNLVTPQKNLQFSQYACGV